MLDNSRSAVLLAVAAASCFLAGLGTAWALSAWALQPSGERSARGKQLAVGSRTCNGVLGAIGNTPLIRITSLSEETGCEIYGKAEFLNPGGSVKDRVALQLVREAMDRGDLRPGDLITEGTAGSTGISLALVAAAVGCRCFIAMPDDAAIEKVHMLQALGAEVQRVRPVSITHPDHHINVARRRAAQEGCQAQLSGMGAAAEQPTAMVEVQRHGGSAQAALNMPAEATAYHGQSKQPTGMAASDLIQQAPPDATGALIAQPGSRPKENGMTASQPSDCQTRMQSQPDVKQATGNQTSSSAGIGQGAAAALSTSPSRQGVRALFADQFENLANFRAHLVTGSEIWRQTNGHLHAFVSGAGTGGTIAGVSSQLLKHDPSIRIYLIDPPGSSLYNKVTRGVMYAREEAEGKRLRNPFDTITEGIGVNRLTHNFGQAQVHGAFKGSDREAVEMAAYLLRNDGLFLGSSAAMNCVGAVKAARLLGPGHTIVTILCDGGQRHLSKFHNPQYLESQGLMPKATGRHLGFVQ